MDASALLSGLAGALIGSLTSIGTLVVQNSFQTRRESERLMYDTAFRDYELIFRYEAQGTPRRAAFPVILAYHKKMLELVETGKLTPQAARGILEAQVEMTEALQKEVARVESGAR
jgi:hypothetical protein